MLSICGLVVIALVWSFIGRIDVIATASGKTIPTGSVKVIQPIEIGQVRAIHVRNGQQVEAGQLLIELDPTFAGADEASATKGLLAAEIASARNAALLAYLDGRRAQFVAPEGAPPEIVKVQENLILTAIAEYESQRASLAQRRAQFAADLAGAEAEVAKLRETMPLVDQQMASREELAAKGYYSKLLLLEYRQRQKEHVQNIKVQQANAARARASIADAEAQLLALKGNFGKSAVTELSESQEKSGLAREELTKSARRRQYQQLRAPVSGTVQQLAVSTIGGVVQAAQPLLIIVPDDAQPVVEAHILNRDIGFVHPGQKVRVKLEAYPFTDYGIVPGIIEHISRDAIDMSAQGEQMQKDEAGRPQQQGLVYAARIRLLKRNIRVGSGNQQIGPGLAVQAEIKTGERRIIDFLLSPIAQTMDEAARER